MGYKKFISTPLFLGDNTKSGNVGDLDRKELAKALVGTQITFPVGHRFQLANVNAECIAFTEIGNLIEMTWEFTLYYQQFSAPSPGDTCFATMFDTIQVGKGPTQFILMMGILGFPTYLNAKTEDGLTLRLRDRGTTEFRVGSSSDAPVMSMSGGSQRLFDFRFEETSDIPLTDTVTAKWLWRNTF